MPILAGRAAPEKCAGIFLCIECEAGSPNTRYRPSAGSKYPLYKSPDLCEGYISLSNGEAFFLLCSSSAHLPDVCLIEKVSSLKAKSGPRLEGFHFHQLRHTFTSNLLSNGAAPKDVQELLGHADVSTTMNIYAHSTREAKRSSARLLDKVIGGN